jgi:glycyl-tRNA synthetase beta chain
MHSADLLIELGTEELPPMALRTLAHALADDVLTQVDEAGLAHGEMKVFAAPRRLGFLIPALQTHQADREVEKRGPAVQAAFDDDGNPTKAATGFAGSVGLDVNDLDTLETDKGSWLLARVTEKGRDIEDMMPAFLERAVQKLPIPKRMRWGKRTVQFVRPVHWLVALLGEKILDMTLLDQKAGRITRGHRFHGVGEIELAAPEDYEPRLEQEGFVMADFERRREMIQAKVVELGKRAGGSARIEDALLEEVTALVEWPVPLLGHFEEDFLRVPQEALIYAMAEHQKYFPVLDEGDKLMPAFITVSNIESKDDQVVIAGNEKVIRPRLADAAFFYDNDCRKTLEEHFEPLEKVVFQQQLGTVAEKCRRISQLAAGIATQINGDADKAARAGLLSKADLTTEMVGEFDSMQGVMGYYLARNEGLDAEIASALSEQYLPRFAGDHTPHTATGQAIAIADKLDTLVGIFGIGQKPSGDKDPYALRRASLGILRTVIDNGLDLDLPALVHHSIELFGDRLSNDGVAEDVVEFLFARYRAMYQEQGVATPIIRAVLAVSPSRPMDFDRRIRAVQAFMHQPEAEALAAANKRVGNILSKQGGEANPEVNTSLLSEAAEQTLYQALQETEVAAKPLLANGEYDQALNRMASLRQPVDSFFDDVMVMAEDEAVKANRLALLSQLRGLFMAVADIGELQA